MNGTSDALAANARSDALAAERRFVAGDALVAGGQEGGRASGASREHHECDCFRSQNKQCQHLVASPTSNHLVRYSYVFV